MKIINNSCEDLFVEVEHFVSSIQQKLVATEQFQVGMHHFFHKAFYLDLRFPAELFACLACISHKQIYLSRPKVARIYLHQYFSGFGIESFFLSTTTLPFQTDVYLSKSEALFCIFAATLYIKTTITC